jgi:Tol biopolymer transport system component
MLDLKNFKEVFMRKVLIRVFCLALVFVGCIRHWEEEVCVYTAPNWTSDGKIVFMRDHYIQKWTENTLLGAVNQAGCHQDIFVCEIDVDGRNFREVCKIAEGDFELGRQHFPISTSSAGDYIVISKEDWTKGEHYTEMFIMKRDGTGLKNLGEGSYPDLSPDGKKIVYQKPNQGLWIKNIDGTGDRQIVVDSNAAQPSWGPNGWKIAYTLIPPGAWAGGLIISDTAGNKLIIFFEHGYGLGFNTVDWAPIDSNAIITQYNGKATIIYLEDSLRNRIVENAEGYNWGWSPNGEWLCSQTSQGILIIKSDGSNKHYIKP